MAHIPEHIVDQVRTVSDIVEIVGDDVRLVRRGKNFIGLCPFHNEKTPSFNVNPELGIYKCFGCGKGGNAITFLMEHHGFSFFDAVKNLADRAGIRIEIEEEENSEELSRLDKAYKVLTAAKEFYAKQLQTEAGATTKRYFSSRNFNEKSIADFALGFAPDGWSTTMNELLKQGFDTESLSDAGLVVTNDSGTTYDRFRGRAMFAIHDTVGRIVGFGARQLVDDKTQPKYINSPQSIVYDKSKVLYGLYQAKQSIRQEKYAILVEGYADVLTLAQEGVSNVVASSGTSLTKEQLQLLSRYTNTLTIVYDGDEAGINAAVRGVSVALAEGFEINILTLPNKEDPDSFVRAQGADTFRQYVLRAQPFVDFVAEHMRKQGLLATPKGQAEAVRSLVSLVARIPDRLQHDFYLRSLAEKFSISEQLLRDELRVALPSSAQATDRKPNSRQYTKQYQQRSSQSTSASADATTSHQATNVNSAESSTASTTSNAEKSVKLLAEEKALLYLAITSPKAFNVMETTYRIAPETFVAEEARNVFRAVQHAHHHGVEVAGHIMNNQSLSEQERGLIAEMLFNREQPSARWQLFNVEIQDPNIDKMISDVLLRLKLFATQQQLEVMKERIKVNDNDTEALIHIVELNKQRVALEHQLRQIEELHD